MGLNSLGDLDKDSSWWELLLQGEVRLVVGLSGGGGACMVGSSGESGVRACAGLEVGVDLKLTNI